MHRLFTCLLVAAILALLAAYGVQSFLHMPPCKLCEYQRIPYALLIIVACLGLIHRSLSALYCYLSIALLIISTSIAAFHFGVEKKWFQYESECIISLKQGQKFDDFKEMIKSSPIVTCDQPLLDIMGISMAGWNVMYSLILLAFTIFMVINKDKFSYDKKRNSTNFAG